MVSPEIQRGGLQVKSALQRRVAAACTASSRSTRRSAPSTSSAAACSASTDEEQARRVAIIGADAAAQLFGDARQPRRRRVRSERPAATPSIGKIRKKDQDSNYSGPDNDKVFVPFAAMARDFPAHRRAARRGVATSSSRRSQWVVDELPRVLDARTGRIEDIDWPLERDVRRVLARRHGFDPDDRDAMRDVGHLARRR